MKDFAIVFLRTEHTTTTTIITIEHGSRVYKYLLNIRAIYGSRAACRPLILFYFFVRGEIRLRLR